VGFLVDLFHEWHGFVEFVILGFLFILAEEFIAGF
jgi:hypothetical protein